MSVAGILIVEDEMIVARELEWRLVGFGYKVLGIAISAVEALELTEKTRPDLVLMDIVLKGDSDGIDAAAQIRHRWTIPVIYLTAFADDASLRRAGATEPDGYIVKPFSADQLRASVELALRRRPSRAAAADADEPGGSRAEFAARLASLSPREAEVLALIVKGKSQKQIAAEFEISVQTVAKHRAKVLEKLSVENDIELVHLAMRFDRP
jgi:DNA-binding NarL/FixJ family response regulator